MVLLKLLFDISILIKLYIYLVRLEVVERQVVVVHRVVVAVVALQVLVVEVVVVQDRQASYSDSTWLSSP